MKQALKKNAWVLIGLVLAAFAMRAPTTSVGPMIPLIKADLQLNSAVSGMLTTIPLVLFALVAPFAGRFARLISTKTQVIVCLFSIFSGILVRSYLGLVGLFLGTALLGFGIGTLNVIMPVIVKTCFPSQIGFVTGLYTTGMTIFAALASGVIVWLSQSLGGWRNAMGAFALLPLLAMLMWLPLGRVPSPEKAPPIPVRTLLADRGNLAIAFFMASQSFMYFTMTTWLPSILLEKGMGAAEASALMLTLQLASTITKFLWPALAQRYPHRRGWIALVPGVFYGSGFLLVMLGGQSNVLLWAGGIVAGLAAGMSMTLSLTFVAMKGRTPAETAQISSFSQTIGYTLAAPGPLLIGALADATGGFAVPVMVILAASCVMCFMGRNAGRSLEPGNALQAKVAAQGATIQK